MPSNLFPGKITHSREANGEMQHIFARFKFSCSTELKDLDFKGLIERSHDVKREENQLTWYDWERYSQRQSERMTQGGFIDEISFAGPWQEFLPSLSPLSFL